MSTTLFPVLTSVLWREAIARGRAEGEMDLRRFREQVALSQLSHGAKEAPCHAQLKPSEASTSLPRAVEQHGQLSTLPPACGSASNDTGGGLSAGVGVKVIESVGRARGQSGADECMPNYRNTNRVAVEAAQAVSADSNSGATCLAPEPISPAAGSAAPGRSGDKRRAEAGGWDSLSKEAA